MPGLNAQCCARGTWARDLGSALTGRALVPEVAADR
jgi:hypothetical protein